MNYQDPTAEECLALGKILHIKPQGVSMLPLIKEGRDSVYVGKAIYEEIRKGDIVLYRNEQQFLVLHRLCEKTPKGFYAIGDNQLLAAGPYEKERLIGKMIAMERKGRYIDSCQTSMRLYGWLWTARRKVLLIVRGLVKGRWNSRM